MRLTARLRSISHPRAAGLLLLAGIAATVAIALCPAPVRAADGGGAGATAATTTATAPVRIACIGDSITQGRQGNSGDPNNLPVYSYRYDLWKKFVDAAIPVDFVGSMNGGFNGDPSWPDYLGHAFDRDHEGHWGWKTVDVADHLTSWTATYPVPADIALVLLGSNDGASSGMQPTIDAMTRIVAILRARNPHVVVIIGQCFQEWAPFPAMRAAMVTLAAAQTTPDSPVVTVDHSVGWVSIPTDPNTDTVDWVHPNQRGDTMLSANWFAAIQPYLTRETPEKKKSREATWMLRGQ